jgi:DNA-binding MarR family transcriptional regulator
MSNPRAIPPHTRAFVRDHCLCLHVQRSARVLARRFDEALRPAHLNNGQFSLLMALSRPEPVGVGSLAALLGMDRTTLTANLKPLRRRGLVSIAIDPADRRGRLLTLTDAGLTALRQALPLWERAHAELDRQLQAFDADQLRAGLQALA